MTDIVERTAEIDQPYTGGCACGAIRFEISGEPVFQNDCQCRDCQRKSGTGHGSYLTFPRGGVKYSGEATLWDMVGDSGNVKTRAFCPHCGSPVYLTFAAMPDVFTVHAASLDDPGRYRPQAVTYGVRGHAWDFLDPALLKFDRMPPM
ncbi:GFA family protein [Variovorax sp. ZS18.2.2]|uniref:GFA family protein n=1 Tax=Variovorax sp. ZS18.2.2 TaxID=2971255 RepID=UPI00215088F4|nr:GFA family protein [Variovorax sp. ZS18.2.2]MCR6477261.1 GFA family protein [Variovorax sp. ZS18.2.2]